MKKIILLILILIGFILNSNEISNSILLSFNLCIYKLFPSIIPFMLLSNFLIEYNFFNEITILFKPLMNLFNINKYVSFAFFLSLLSGSPAVSIYLNNLYKKGVINESDIQKTLNFCHYTNPLFVINVIGINYLNSKKLGIIILVSEYISSFIIALIFRGHKPTQTNYTNNKTKPNFFNTLKISILECTDKLLLILGIITFFLIITTLLKINNNPIAALFEITQGVNIINNLNINILIKSILFSSIISFGGFSIHVQVFSIINNKKIRYKPYLICRILQAILSAIITFIISLMH